MPANLWEPSALCDTVTRRLLSRFDALPLETVERCVRSAWVCALHVGARVDLVLLETLAEELLAALPPEVATPPRGLLPDQPGNAALDGVPGRDQ